MRQHYDGEIVADTTRTMPEHDVPADAADFEYPKDWIVSYAQTHEDVLLWRALHSVTPGFYVDVGAHDPTDLSVTRAFYERGWRGINIEPIPFYAKRLREERPRDQILEVALGDKPGIATLYDFGGTGLSTIDTDIAKEHAASGFPSSELRVPVITLAAAVDGLGNQDVHFLKIDVEGYERQVLSGADFNKFRPWIVLVEATKPLTTKPSFGAWEPLLLNAGYHFVYFDGLNRFYVSEEHLDLKRYFSVPVSTADPFGDHKVLRLSAAVEALERERLKHEVPRLQGTAQPCESSNAAGLRRVVEAQAADLVRLRRALVSLQPAGSQSREDEILAAKEELSEWIRSIVISDLVRTQETITDVLRQSRWRRLGGRLGAVRQMSWETGRWRTHLLGANNSAEPDTENAAHESSIPDLLAELKRLNGLLDEIRGARWRKLGQWLGLEERSAWEAGLWRSPLLLQPFPVIEATPKETSPPVRLQGKSRPSPTSHEGFVEYITQRFIEECRGFATDVILDIGANTGQFARDLRARGYHGHIVSFEPLSQAYAELVGAADSDPLWDVAERCAIGANDGWAEINIAGNSYSSSLLPMLDLHREAAPHSAYTGKEPCRVTTLDSFVDGTFSDPTTIFGVKIDTQGYEAEVLAGLKRNHNRVKVILCEMSVAPLYARGPTMSELSDLLAELNYHCVALCPELLDPRTGKLLQVNGVFVKRASTD